VIATLATPLAWLVLYGGLMQSSLALRFGGVQYLAFITPGLVVLMATMFALNSGARTMADKQMGFLKEVLVSPVGRMEVILGRTLGVCTIVSLQSLILVGIPFLWGDGVPAPYGALSLLGVMLAVSLLALGFVGVGMIMAVRGKNPQSFQALLGLLTLPMFFLSGALLPPSRLPDWAQALAAINPMAYAVNVARGAALGTEHAYFPLELSLLGLFGFALFTLSMGARNLREA
jgi:ABC-2 type transport system permease protein